MYISRRFLQRKNADILLKLTLNINQSINQSTGKTRDLSHNINITCMSTERNK